MRCPKCGKELQENAQFCLYCMHSLKDKPDVTPEKPRKATKYLVLTVIILCAMAVIVTGCCYILNTLREEPPTESSILPSDTDEAKDIIPVETAEPEGRDTTEDTAEDTTELPITEDVETKPLYTWATVEAEGGVAVIGLKEGNYKIRDYVIPEAIDGKTVVGIDFDGDYHYDSWEGVITLELPDTVTYIGHDVFHNCELESITLPEGLISIGDLAFQGSALKSIIVPDTVTEIGVSAFYSCRELEYIKLSSSITRIESNTFYDCQALTEIDIPESVTYIDGSAFYCSENLANVYIYSTDIDMDEYAFDPEYREADLTIYAREGIVREYADREYYNNSYYNDRWRAKLVVWDGNKNQ